MPISPVQYFSLAQTGMEEGERLTTSMMLIARIVTAKGDDPDWSQLGLVFFVLPWNLACAIHGSRCFFARWRKADDC